MTNDIPPLPDEIIEAARQLFDDTDGQQWHVGDFIVGVVDELEDRYTRLGVKRARAWLIKHLAERTGRDTSTLRDRECMARFFPVDVRREYDGLTYHQLRATKSAGDNWREYADWAAGNLPAPVAIIRARIRHNGVLPPAWVARWEKLVELAEAIRDDDEAPKGARYSVDYFLWLACESGLIDVNGDKRFHTLLEITPQAARKLSELIENK